LESWQVSVIIGVITYISMFVTIRNKTDQHGGDIKELKDKHEKHRKEEENLHSKMFDKLDDINQEIATHKVRLGSAPSMEQVRAEFVTKEMFKQMEKHIDDKFDRLEAGLTKILDKLDKKD